MYDDEDILKQKPKFTFEVEMLPETKQNLELKAKKADEEAQKRKELEIQKKRVQQQEQEKEKEKIEMKKKEAKEQQMRIVQAKLKKEEEEQRSKLEGRLEIMIQRLNENNTPFEYTLAGLELGQIRSRILSDALVLNKTLLSLHLSRKKIGDEEGEAIGKILGKGQNSTLQKLELEGNSLGPNSAKAFAISLMDNQSLRILDLESNNLTTNNHDTSGIIAIADMLKVNKRLLSLNLSNNMIDSVCGDYLEKAMKKNTTLIDFDISLNPYMTLKQRRNIQSYLIRNKEAYEKERMLEWKERKAMHAEYEAMKNLILTEEGKSIEEQEKEKAKEKRETARYDMWNQKVQDFEEQKMRLMKQLTENSIIRNTRGKKKKRRGMGKKGMK